MPMRIISQGRQAYILAGYLMKRGKWSWQWSERYFVLTSSALHYFKRDRRALYGQERGAFMLDDMVLTEHADKLCIELRSISTNVSRMLKAPTEREYLTWCRALHDALKNRSSTNSVQSQGVSLDSLHTVAPNHADPTYSAENSQSQSSMALGPGTHRTSVGGISTHPLHGTSQTSTPLHVRNPTASSTRSNHLASPPSTVGGPTPRLNKLVSAATAGSPSTTLAVTVEPPTTGKPRPKLDRAQSSPSSSQELDVALTAGQSQAAAAAGLPRATSPDGLVAAASSSGYSSGISASPISVNNVSAPPPATRSNGFDQEVGAASSSGLHQPVPGGLLNHALNKLRASSTGGSSSPPASSSFALASSTTPSRHHHEVEDVLRKYSFQDGSPPSALRSLGGKYGIHGTSPSSGSNVRDPIAMVTIGPADCAAATRQAAACAPPRVIAGSCVHWNTPLVLPGFPLGSTMQVAFADGATCELVRDALEKEVAADLREGTKILPVGGHGHEATHTQVLLSWRCTPSAPVRLTSPQRLESAIGLGLPLAYLVLALIVLAFDWRAIGAAHALLMVVGAALAATSFRAQLATLRQKRQAPPTWQVTFVSVLGQPAPAAPTNTLASSAAAAAHAAAAAAAASASGVSPVKSTDGSSGGATSAGFSQQQLQQQQRLKKHGGILRRRANDLPVGMSPSVVAAVQPELLARERGHFELSEFESEGESLDSGTSTRENSQIGGGGGRGGSSSGLRSRRSTATTSSSHSRGQSSGADADEHESTSLPLTSSSAPPPHLVPLPLTQAGGEIGLHASPPPGSSATLSVPIATAAQHHRPSSSDSDLTLINSASGPLSTSSASSASASSSASATSAPRSGASSGRSEDSSSAPTFARVASGRSEDSDVRSSTTRLHSGGGGVGGGGATDVDEVTDVESRGATSDADGHDAFLEDEATTQAIQEAMNHYEDQPIPIASAHMPPENPAPWGAWSEDDTSALNVRGPTFLVDKIKIPVGVPIFKLAHVDMFYTSQSNDNLVHVTARPGNWGYKYLERRDQLWRDLHAAAGAPAINPEHKDPNNPLFVMNFLFPGPAHKNMNLVLYFIRRIRPGDEMKRRQASGIASGFTSAAGSKRGSRVGTAGGGGGGSSSGIVDDLLSLSTLKPNFVQAPPGGSSIVPRVSYTSAKEIARVCAFDSILRRFLDGPISSPTLSAQQALDEFRDCRLKIIPRIAAGPWIVRKGVGCVPAILGKKVKQKYYRSEAGSTHNYLEVVADVSSSMVAGRILALVKGAATALTIELSFTLQGENESELPESLLGGVRILRCNLDALMEVDEHEKWLANTWLPKEEREGRW